MKIVKKLSKSVNSIYLSSVKIKYHFGIFNIKFCHVKQKSVKISLILSLYIYKINLHLYKHKLIKYDILSKIFGENGENQYAEV